MHPLTCAPVVFRGFPRLALPFLVLLLSNSCGTRADEPNDEWATATDVGTARLVRDRIDFTSPTPDTTLGVFDEGGVLTAVDDDGSFFGDGTASALLGQAVNADGSIRFAVSGFGDFDFDGLDDQRLTDQPQSGDFQAFLTVYGSEGRVIESDDFLGTLVPGGAVAFPPVMATEWIGGTFDLELNNLLGPPSDVDFWLFSGLPAGVQFIAEVVDGEFDTLLGLYNDQGELIDSDDDAGAPPLSRLEGLTPNSGNIYLAVTAYPDGNYEGVHSATGEYTLALSVVPEPTALMGSSLLLSLGLLARRSAHSKQ